MACGGVPGPHLCPIDLPALQRAAHKCRPGSLGERFEINSPGYEAGRRLRHQRGRCPSRYHRTTTLMAQRWAAKGGPEGRGRGKLPIRSTTPDLTTAMALQCYGSDFLSSRQGISYHARVRWDNNCDGLYDVLGGLCVLCGETAMCRPSRFNPATDRATASGTFPCARPCMPQPAPASPPRPLCRRRHHPRVRDRRSSRRS